MVKAQQPVADGRARTAGLVTGIGLGIVHLGALAALLPGTFSWSAVIVMLVLYYITGAWGITLGFHRTLTHRSLRVRRGLEPVLAFIGVLALQGGPIEWVATHRAHHANTDREGDPHDIHRGAWWSHMAWLYRHNEHRLTKEQQDRLAPDLANSRYYRFLENTYLLWQIVLGLALLAPGLLFGWMPQGQVVNVVLITIIIVALASLVLMRHPFKLPLASPLRSP